MTKAQLTKLLHYRTDRTDAEIADLVGTQESYVRQVVADLPETHEPELVGSLHECREHDVVRYVKCVDCDAVFDLDAVGRTRRPHWDTVDEPVTHVDWFQHTEFEGYVITPEGEDPPDRPTGAVKNRIGT